MQILLLFAVIPLSWRVFGKAWEADFVAICLFHRLLSYAYWVCIVSGVRQEMWWLFQRLRGAGKHPGRYIALMERLGPTFPDKAQPS